MMTRQAWMALCATLLLSSAAAFTTSTPLPSSKSTLLNAKRPTESLGKFVASVLLVTMITLPSPVLADEYGVETEAPTLFTGETVMVRSLMYTSFTVMQCTLSHIFFSQICQKRGPLGACLETVPRTAENDNDKASKYFKEPVVRSKMSSDEELDSNALIQKLKQQTEDNREKNELSVKTKTMINDQVCHAFLVWMTLCALIKVCLRSYILTLFSFQLDSLLPLVPLIGVW